MDASAGNKPAGHATRHQPALDVSGGRDQKPSRDGRLLFNIIGLMTNKLKYIECLVSVMNMRVSQSIYGP